MNSIALTMMLSTMLLVICTTAYFFVKVLRTPTKPDTGMDNIQEGEERTFRYDAT